MTITTKVEVKEGSDGQKSRRSRRLKVSHREVKEAHCHMAKGRRPNYIQPKSLSKVSYTRVANGSSKGSIKT